jgi:hypothetical protein
MYWPALNDWSPRSLQVQELIQQRDTVSQKEQENLRLVKQLQASEADLQCQNHRLNDDNVRQAHRLHELDDMYLELLEEVDRLKRQGLCPQKITPDQMSDEEKKPLGGRQVCPLPFSVQSGALHKDNKLQTTPLKSEFLGFPGASPKAQHRNDQDIIILSSDEDELEDAVYRERRYPETDSDRRLPIGLPSLGRNVPLSRRIQSSPRDLDVLPDLDMTTLTIFNRQHLNTYLGGGLIALQAR